MESLATLSVDELAERLVEIAQRARKLSDDDGGVVLHEMLEAVQKAGDHASGDALALLEVAEAFLRALARSDLGKAELALRRFLLEAGEKAEAIFADLVDSRNVTISDINGLEPELHARFEDLFEVGVLRRRPDATFDLRPSMRALARDLLDPAVIRMWRRVQHARAFAGTSHMREDQASHFLASQLAVSTQQARRFLRTDPVVGTFSAVNSADELLERRPVSHVVYSRPAWVRQDLEKGTTGDEAVRPLVGSKEYQQQPEGVPSELLSSSFAQLQEALH